MPLRRYILILMLLITVALTGCGLINTPTPTQTSLINDSDHNSDINEITVKAKPGQLESFARVYAVIYEDSSEIFPNSSEKRLTPLEISGYTPYQLEWAWREIAARHGKIFSSHDFNDRSWFIEDNSFSPSTLSAIEADNIMLIRDTISQNNARYIKTNGSINTDLNGDGQDDAISFTCDEAASDGVLAVNNRNYPISMPRMDGLLYLTDIDENDGTMEVAIPYTSSGSVRYVALYGLDAAGIFYYGSIPGDFSTIRFFGGGSLDGNAPGMFITQWFYRQPYRLNDGKLYKADVAIMPMLIKTTLKTDLILKTGMAGDESGKNISFSKGTNIILLASDTDGNIAVLNLATRETGYMHISNFDYVDEANTRQSDVFEGLIVVNKD